MNQDTFPPAASLHPQIARLCVLERYLIEAFDLQRAEPALTRSAAAHDLVVRSLDILREQVGRIGALADIHPGAWDDFRESSAALAAFFLPCISKRRPRALPAMLSRDQTMLQLALANYELLQTLGLESGYAQIEKVARRHRRELTPLAFGFGRLLLPLQRAANDAAFAELTVSTAGAA